MSNHDYRYYPKQFRGTGAPASRPGLAVAAAKPLNPVLAFILTVALCAGVVMILWFIYKITQ